MPSSVVVHRRCEMSLLVVIVQRHRISSVHVVVMRHVVVLHRCCTLTFLHFVVCHRYALLSSSAKTDHWFLSKCLGEFLVICIRITCYMLVSIMLDFRTLLMAVSCLGAQTSGTQTSGTQMAASKCPALDQGT